MSERSESPPPPDWSPPASDADAREARQSLDGFVPMMIYFGYMTVLSMCFFLITGTIGFFSSYYFNVTIYSYLKVD